jgi:hypothetical protein
LLGVGTIGVDEALEGRAAGRHVSLEKRALSKRRQGWCMARINLKDSTPKPVSFFVPPGTRGAYGFRFEGVDFLKAWVGMVHRVF